VSVAQAHIPTQAPAKGLPSLESGDRLTRAEFHRRYEGRPDIKKAELVEGVVYVGLRVPAVTHGMPHADMAGWLSTFSLKMTDLHLAISTTVLLDADNELQPDVILWCEAPGGPRVTDDDFVEGAPQLVVEVAASSATYDLHDKMRAYRRNGVREYVGWRVLDRAIDWFSLREGEYVRVEPDAQGVIESEAFPGLRLDVPKMLAGDLAGVLARLRQE
jgi:Uma2 family endonuclease